MVSMRKNLRVPKDYSSALSLRETEKGIKRIKDFFEGELSKKLNLMRVSAPLFVRPTTGINDNLNGVERPVAFDALDIKDSDIEIVHSLAKWKRLALKRYEFSPGEGIYTDMNAIRRDEVLDNIHSMYVDQWDWEKVIKKEERTPETLKKIVEDIYDVFKRTEEYVGSFYENYEKILPEDIYFITSQQLEDMYPELSPKERENKIAKDKRAVFIMQIGKELKSGKPHDGRAPDYDDWSLNGDIIFWYPVLEMALELSSMGIRVDEKALENQLKISGCEDRRNQCFHRLLLDGQLPYTVGGGIGQSRICMFFLRKAHIGEVQASIWPEYMMHECMEEGIKLL